MRHVGTLWAKRSLLSTSLTSACSSAVRARAGAGQGATGEGHTKWLVVELDACATDMFEAVEQSYRYLVGNGLARGNKPVASDSATA